MTAAASEWGPGILEEGREDIIEWREKRIKMQARQKTYLGFTTCEFSLGTLRTFVRNFSCMIFVHIASGSIAVFISKRFNLFFDIQLSLLISPIVFPLAFSINTDFQRRDLVLQYIAHYESSAMILYLCLREWRKSTGFENKWLKRVHAKLKSVLFLLREYLFTGADECRTRILRAMYEDFSDVSLIIEELRTSKLQANGPLISRCIHLLNVMTLSFERLRVVKEYRSPRSIRAFNKVLITILPIFMAPYFVYLGKKTGNEWSPYLISVVISFVFSSLQGVQDKLDDPFDGLGEDDIKMNAIEEWTLTSFEQTAQRLDIGRINVNKDGSNGFGEFFPDKGSNDNTSSRVEQVKTTRDEPDVLHSSSTDTVTTCGNESKSDSTSLPIDTTYQNKSDNNRKNIEPNTYRKDENILLARGGANQVKSYEGHEKETFANHFPDEQRKKQDRRNYIKDSVRLSNHERNIHASREGYSQPNQIMLGKDRTQNTHSDLGTSNYTLPADNIQNNQLSENVCRPDSEAPSSASNVLYYNINASGNDKIENIKTFLEKKVPSIENPNIITVAKIVAELPSSTNDHRKNNSIYEIKNEKYEGLLYSNENTENNIEKNSWTSIQGKRNPFKERTDNNGHPISLPNGKVIRSNLVKPTTLPPLRRDINGVLSAESNQRQFSSLHGPDISTVTPTTETLPNNIFCVYSSEKNATKFFDISQNRISNPIDISLQNEIDDPTSIAFLEDKFKLFNIEQLISPNQRTCIADYDKSRKTIIH